MAILPARSATTMLPFALAYTTSPLGAAKPRSPRATSRERPDATSSSTTCPDCGRYGAAVNTSLPVNPGFGLPVTVRCARGDERVQYVVTAPLPSFQLRVTVNKPSFATKRAEVFLLPRAPVNCNRPLSRAVYVPPPIDKRYLPPASSVRSPIGLGPGTSCEAITVRPSSASKRAVGCSVVV